MKELDKSLNDTSPPFESNEGGRILLSSGEVSSRSPSLDSNVLSSETLERLESLGNVLRRIKARLKSEGIEIIDGVVVETDNYESIQKK